MTKKTKKYDMITLVFCLFKQMLAFVLNSQNVRIQQMLQKILYSTVQVLRRPFINLYFASKELDFVIFEVLQAFNVFLSTLAAFSLILGPVLVHDHFQRNVIFCLFF